MRGTLFEDLVVSAPPAGRFGRRAALLPLSIAAHGAALAIALALPVLRSGDLPTPIGPTVRWEPAPAVAPPAPLPTPPPAPRVRSVAPSRDTRATTLTEPVMPPPAPGPMVSMIEPDGLPAVEGPPPCLVNCDGADSRGVGDGLRIGHDGPGGSDGTGIATVRPGGDIKPPVRTVYVAPVYPEIARAARVSGIVVVECTIDPSGRVSDVRVLTGHPLLNPAAVEAVRQWRYTATRLNNVPVAVLMTVTVRFTVSR
jgi:periplasmic protein TonB